jgi:hypothetical protein
VQSVSPPALTATSPVGTPTNCGLTTAWNETDDRLPYVALDGEIVNATVLVAWLTTNGALGDTEGPKLLSPAYEAVTE